MLYTPSTERTVIIPEYVDILEDLTVSRENSARSVSVFLCFVQLLLEGTNVL